MSFLSVVVFYSKGDTPINVFAIYCNAQETKGYINLRVSTDIKVGDMTKSLLHYNNTLKAPLLKGKGDIDANTLNNAGVRG